MNVDELPLLIANPAEIASNNYIKNNHLPPEIKYERWIAEKFDNPSFIADPRDLAFDKLDRHTGIGALLLLINEHYDISLNELLKLWRIVEELNYHSSSPEPWISPTFHPWVSSSLAPRRLQHLLDIALAAELIADPNPNSTFKDESHYGINKLGLALLKQNGLDVWNGHENTTSTDN